MFLYDAPEFHELICVSAIRLHELHLGPAFFFCAEQFPDNHLLDPLLQLERRVGSLFLFVRLLTLLPSLPLIFCTFALLVLYFELLNWL